MILNDFNENHKYEFSNSILAIIVVIFSFAMLLAYCVAFDAPFYLDTIGHLIRKSNYHLSDLTINGLTQAMRHDFDQELYRPVSGLSLALNYYLTKLSPVGFRVGNLIIHICAFLSLYFLLVSIFRTEKIASLHPVINKYAAPIALLGAMLWAAHPVHTNVVNYIIQRMTSLSGLFTFLSLGCFVRARLSSDKKAWLWWIGMVLTFFLAFASKENAVTIIPLAILLELLLFEPKNKERYRVMVAYVAVAIAILIGIFLLLRGVQYFEFFSTLAEKRDFTIYERVLTQMRLQFWYLFLLLVPDPRILTLDAQVELSRSLLEPQTMAAFLAISGAIVLAFLWRKKRPLVSIGIMWFFLAQLVESTILPLELFFEHRMYVPSIFIYVGVAALVFHLYERTPARRKLIVTCSAVVVILMLTGTASRSFIWADPVRFHLDAIAKSKEKGRPMIALASYLGNRGFYKEAKALLDEAMAVDGEKDNGYIMFNLGKVAQKLENYEEAEQYYLKAVSTDKKLATLGYFSLAHMRYMAEQYPAAIEYARECIKAKSTMPEAWNLLGGALFKKGELEEAEKAFLKAIKYQHHGYQAWLNLANVYIRLMNWEKAAWAYEGVIKNGDLSPEDLKAIKSDLALAREKSREREALGTN